MQWPMCCPEWIAKKLFERGVEDALERLNVERELNMKRLNPENIPSDNEHSDFCLDDIEDPKIIVNIDFVYGKDEFEEYLNDPDVYVCEEDEYYGDLPCCYWGGFRGVYGISDLKDRVLFELKQIFILKEVMSKKANHPLFEPELVSYIQKFVKIPKDIYEHIKYGQTEEARAYRDFPNQEHYSSLIK